MSDKQIDRTQSRKDQIVDAILDEGTASFIDWEKNFVRENVPKALDSIVERINAIFKSITTRSDSSVGTTINKAIFAGIEIGQENKEQALIRAMHQMKISDEQIRRIIEVSNHFLVTREMIESESKK